MNIDISNLITDWDGFESLVSKLCETGDVTVERDVVMVGKSGAPRLAQRQLLVQILRQRPGRNSL
jgi:hypothetical protein